MKTTKQINQLIHQLGHVASTKEEAEQKSSLLGRTSFRPKKSMVKLKSLKPVRSARAKVEVSTGSNLLK